ncbi:isochorismate synthase [Marinomonas sp. CT5]|uniref:isochorismate synthase n=1 Tax=Marinomonas sp. CT5 TaxID=2066133 RepID=UPI001841160E|nr:isochorismate synthase [Marinomonas sp. CT5]NVK71862.1 isochorismate synthase [Oceanospirillaceae bacterium]QUX95337.1 isochorismate synthase [Marinomonas sp. CT5]
MDITSPSYARPFALNPSQDDLFLFNSSFNLVRTNGISQRLNIPVLDHTFSQEVDALFSKEKSQGKVNPILVGAIPFDMSQPAHLVVPEWYEKVTPMDRTMTPFVDPDFVHYVHESGFAPSHVDFIGMIEDVLSRFASDSLKKVVLSKILKLTLDKKVDIPRLLANIMAQNPSAYHFSVPLDNSVLIGASPELLIRKQGNKIFSNPLAGSSKRSNDIDADKQAAITLSNSSKDRYEHQLVVDAIRSALQPIVKNLKAREEPSLISTPTMWHLSTHIEATLSSVYTPSIFDLIKCIHPTPAMCGTPTLQAKSHIESLEPHQRGFFSGLVGWCDAQGNGEWAIAIRCAQVSGEKVTLFAGAGVVPDSDPESEWLETSAKMRTMLNAFGIKDDVI